MEPNKTQNQKVERTYLQQRKTLKTASLYSLVAVLMSLEEDFNNHILPPSRVERLQYGI